MVWGNTVVHSRTISTAQAWKAPKWMQTAVQKVVESINDVLFKLKFNGKGVLLWKSCAREGDGFYALNTHICMPKQSQMEWNGWMGEGYIANEWIARYLCHMAFSNAWNKVLFDRSFWCVMQIAYCWAEFMKRLDLCKFHCLHCFWYIFIAINVVLTLIEFNTIKCQKKMNRICTFFSKMPLFSITIDAHKPMFHLINAPPAVISDTVGNRLDYRHKLPSACPSQTNRRRMVPHPSKSRYQWRSRNANVPNQWNGNHWQAAPAAHHKPPVSRRTAHVRRQ